ncbi:hypothetical protein C8R46DRAFT_1082128 [Mycena filopes]|nr:hypothetical protein C8R46DRAFT_1082128 [Mycena filopes]
MMSSSSSPPQNLRWNPPVTPANATTKYCLTGLGVFFDQPCALCAAEGKQCEIRKKKLRACVRCSERKKTCSHNIQAPNAVPEASASPQHPPQPDEISLFYPWQTSTFHATPDAGVHSAGDALPAKGKNGELATIEQNQSRGGEDSVDWTIFLNIAKEWLADEVWSTQGDIGQDDQCGMNDGPAPTQLEFFYILDHSTN